MAQNVTIAGASYSDVPAIVVPKTGGGSAQFDDTTIASNAAAAGDILSGKKAYVNGDEITGNIVTKTSSDLSASGDTVTVPAGYYASQATKSVSHGDVRYPQYITVENPIMSPPGTSTLTFSKTIEVAPEIVTPGYISTAPARDTIFTLETNIGIKGPETYTPTTSAQTIARGQYLMGVQTIAGDTNLTAGNIKKDVTIFGVTGIFEGGGGGTDVSDTTATAGDVLSGKWFHIADGSYVPGTIPTKTSSDVTVSGKTVSIPAGYYATAASESVADGSATTPATTISVTPSVTVDSSTGVVTAAVSGSQSITPTVSAGYVSTGTAGNVSVSGSNTLALSTAQGGTITPTESQQTAVAAGKYTLGAVTVAGDANLVAGNIKDGTSIFGVTGTFTDASTVSSGQTAATASEILTGYSAWVDGVEVQGTASGGGGGPAVPDAYQKVEYVAIGSSGPYIDLGFVPLNHSVYADIMVVSYDGNVSIFGTESDNTYFHMTEYGNRWYWGTGGTERNSATVAVYSGNRYTLEYNIGSSYEVYANSLLLGSGNQITTQAGNNLFIAKRKNRRGQNLRYYAFKVTDKSTDEMIRNLVPVYRKADNEVGFWDAINNVFYTNDGTGSFTAGPDV